MKNVSVFRHLPDGRGCAVFPYHISLEGMEKLVLCRDECDYDAFVKIIAVSVRRKNGIVVTYVVMSNHCHVVVLAESFDVAMSAGSEIKRIYSMYFSRKYGLKEAMTASDVDVQLVDSPGYLRNVLAYNARNLMDIGRNPDEYKWAGHGAMFKKAGTRIPERRVSELTTRESVRIMRTNMSLADTGWTLNEDNELMPESFCDRAYFEAAFNGSQAYYCKCVGLVNVSEMQYRLIEAPRTGTNDSEFLKSINEISARWFEKGVMSLSIYQKSRLLPYVYHTMRTSIPQLARCFGMSREEVRRLLRK